MAHGAIIACYGPGPYSPWKEGECLTWDKGLADTFAATYVTATSVKAREAAAKLNANKREKYDEMLVYSLILPSMHAVEIMGPVKEDGGDFLSAIGHQISQITNDPRETTFLFQRLSIISRRGSAAVSDAAPHFARPVLTSRLFQLTLK